MRRKLAPLLFDDEDQGRPTPIPRRTRPQIARRDDQGQLPQNQERTPRAQLPHPPRRPRHAHSATASVSDTKATPQPTSWPRQHPCRPKHSDSSNSRPEPSVPSTLQLRIAENPHHYKRFPVISRSELRSKDLLKMRLVRQYDLVRGGSVPCTAGVNRRGVTRRHSSGDVHQESGPSTRTFVRRTILITAAGRRFAARSERTIRTSRRRPRNAVWCARAGGKEARLAYQGNVLVENRNGLVVGAEVAIGDGLAETEGALRLLGACAGQSPGHEMAAFLAANRSTVLILAARGESRPPVAT